MGETTVETTTTLTTTSGTTSTAAVATTTVRASVSAREFIVNNSTALVVDNRVLFLAFALTMLMN